MKLTFLLISTVVVSGIAFSGYKYSQETTSQSDDEPVHIIAMEGQVKEADRFKEANERLERKRLETEIAEEESDEDEELSEIEEKSVEVELEEELEKESEPEEPIENVTLASSEDVTPPADEEVKVEKPEVEDVKSDSASKKVTEIEGQTKKEPKEEPQVPFNGKANVNVTNYLLPQRNSAPRIEKLTHVVIHFTSNALNNPSDPYKVKDTYDIFNSYGVSAHYVIDRGGHIYLFVEEDRIAYHAGKGRLPDFPEYNDRLNHHSIGIELLAIGTREEMIPVIGEQSFNRIDDSLLGYTDAQYTALNALISDINTRHPHVQRNRHHIVGHDTYSPGRKTDPGILFNWSRIGL